MSRERLELTFGAKDMDLWQYISQQGLPKASIVKSIIRDHMNNQNNTQAFSRGPSKIDETNVIKKEIVEKKEKTSKSITSPFGGFVKKV